MKCLLSQLKAVLFVAVVGIAAWAVVSCVPQPIDETEAGKPNAFITDNEKYARMMGPTPKKKVYSEAEAAMPSPRAVNAENIKYYRPSWEQATKSFNGFGF